MLDTAAASSEPEKRAEGLKAVRATFLKNTVETGIKLANHAAIEPGPGVLILCGDGQAWGRAQLDEFAKVYFNERVDFGIMIRQQDCLVPTLFEYLPQPVRLT